MSRGKRLLLTLKAVRIHILNTILWALVAIRWDMDGLVAVLIGCLSATLLTANDKYEQLENAPESQSSPRPHVKADAPPRAQDASSVIIETRAQVRTDGAPRTQRVSPVIIETRAQVRTDGAPRTQRVSRVILKVGGILVVVLLLIAMVAYAYLYRNFR